jgi:hemerythrin
MWKESYRIGIELIDTQHQELFQRITDFLKVIKGQGKWEQKIDRVKETSSFMQSYVVKHFSDEEVYQKKINYPNCEGHHQLHEEFKAEVSKYAEKLVESGYNEDVAQEFAGKLMTWLIYHVAKEDQEIGKYVRLGEKTDER